MRRRLRRAWAQLLLPCPEYDLLTDTFRVPVSGEVLEAMGKWSQPVQVRIVDNGRGVEMEVRTAEPRIETRRVRVVTRPSRRLRLKYAWLRLRLGRDGRRLADAAAAEMDRQVLGL